MRTAKLSKSLRECLKRNWSNIQLGLFFIAVVLVILRTFFATQKEIQISNELRKNTVIYLGDKIVLDKNIKSDTINLKITEFNSDTVLIVNEVDGDTIETLIK